MGIAHDERTACLWVHTLATSHRMTIDMNMRCVCRRQFLSSSTKTNHIKTNTTCDACSMPTVRTQHVHTSSVH
jgi:hypothetical protein